MRVYNFISDGDGIINFDKYENIEFPFNEEDKERILKNSYVFKVLGENMQPFFIDNDIIYFTKKKFEGWEKLDRKLILVKIENDYYIRKIYFQKGKAFLFSFNENVYPEKEITDKVEFIGVLAGQLKRYVEKIKF